MNPATAILKDTGNIIIGGSTHFFRISTCYPALFGKKSKFLEHKLTIIKAIISA